MAWKCFMVTKNEHPPEKSPGGGIVTRPYFVDEAGKHYEFDELPAGAMFLSGPLLHVKLPTNRFWCPDRPASNSGLPWQRTGTPPHVTCSPSIDCPSGYHGWLRDGVLTDDCEGRTP